MSDDKPLDVADVEYDDGPRRMLIAFAAVAMLLFMGCVRLFQMYSDENDRVQELAAIISMKNQRIAVLEAENDRLPNHLSTIEYADFLYDFTKGAKERIESIENPYTQYGAATRLACQYLEFPVELRIGEVFPEDAINFYHDETKRLYDLAAGRLPDGAAPSDIYQYRLGECPAT